MTVERRNQRLQQGFSGERCYVIAEIGTNHGKRLEQALELLDACAEAGADAVKFQSWNVDSFQNTLERDEEGHFSRPSAAHALLRDYQLPDAWHGELAARAHGHGIGFLSTPFDPERAQFLAKVGVDAIKVASGDMNYHELLDAIAELSLPVVLSTGMADNTEIQASVARIKGRVPALALLHCVADYPPQEADANLRCIPALRETFGVASGWSDHYRGNVQSLGAAALGASFIERHVTLSRDNPDPDAPFALLPSELAAMITGVRSLEVGLGDGRKACAPCEAGGRVHGRRSLYASQSLKAGTVLERSMIRAVRPAMGDLSATDLAVVLGKVLDRDVDEGQPLPGTLLP